MDDQGDFEMPNSDSKLIGGKRASEELGEKQDISCKRIKMRNLESVLRAREMNTHHLKNKEDVDKFQFGEEISQVTNVPITLDLEASRAERSGRTTFSIEVNPLSAPLDLNSEAFIADNSAAVATPECGENSNKISLLKKHYKEFNDKHVGSGVIGLDLNTEDVSSVNQDPLFLQKSQDHLKLREASECASTTGPVEQKDPLRVWKEMKQNGFLSSSHGGISIQSSFMPSSHGGIPMPKQRGRKTKNDALKKKIELAKREQVDRFTKIAAPSGLLNGLNPGIINHVRNKKQVHSIIEALVRSEKRETDCSENKQASSLKNGNKELASLCDSGMHQPGLSHGEGSSTALCGIEQTGVHPISGREGHSSLVDRTCGMDPVSNSDIVIEDDTLALRLSSSTKASQESSTFSNEESDNVSSVSYLSLRAAGVASQWLELLHQDIKGRLSALRRSKKRVRSVITTELPFLISKEFSSQKKNDSYKVKNASDGLPSNSTAAMHQARWNTLFNQLDKALSEEENQLECWLNQVKDMQQHCDHGLQYFHYAGPSGSQQQGPLEYYTRPGKADDRELTVRAAAASIYSTCNFVMSKENVPCF